MGPEPEPKFTARSIEEWTRRLAAGEDEAWRSFHQEHYLFLLRYAATRASDGSSAKDIVQDAYLRIARHIRPFSEERAFRSWLACLVRCAAVDHARHRARRSRLLEQFAHWREAHAGHDMELGAACLPASSLIDEVLSQLPDKDATLLRRKYCEGWSVQELAVDAQLTPKTIENRLARLRQRLRNILCRPAP